MNLLRSENSSILNIYLTKNWMVEVGEIIRKPILLGLYCIQIINKSMIFNNIKKLLKLYFIFENSIKSYIPNFSVYYSPVSNFKVEGSNGQNEKAVNKMLNHYNPKSRPSMSKFTFLAQINCLKPPLTCLFRSLIILIKNQFIFLLSNHKIKFLSISTKFNEILWNPSIN